MKMKVGEIEFDSQQRAEMPVVEERTDPTSTKAQRGVALAGAGFAVVTSLIGLVAIVTEAPALLIAAGFTGLGAGASLLLHVVIGWDGKRIARNAEERHERAGDRRLLDERGARLRLLLEEPIGVDDLIDRTKWREEVVLQTLRHLVDQGDVVEDLDVESGRWTYRIDTPHLLEADTPKHVLSLEDRIEAVERGVAAPSVRTGEKR